MQVNTAEDYNKKQNPEDGLFFPLKNMPSGYKFYAETVKLRALKVNEVKKLTNWDGKYSTLGGILGEAVLGVNFEDICLGDVKYILTVLKSLTWEDNNWLIKGIECEHCGKPNNFYIYDTELSFNELDEIVSFPLVYDDEKGTEIILKDIIRIKHKIFLEKFETGVDDEFTYIQMILAAIMCDNLTNANYEKNLSYLNNLKGNVSNDLFQFSELLHFDLNTSYVKKCQHCNKDTKFEADLGTIAHFFPSDRSSDDIRKRIRTSVHSSPTDN